MPTPTRDPDAAVTRAPAVSVVLPTYDREPLLREAVASVLGQTWPDWELIVADDGSRDGTRAYLESLGDSRIRPMFLPRTGDTTSPRQAALAAARGRWVAFLDSDDLWLPDKLALQLARLTARPECRWSYTGYGLIDADGAEGAGRPAPAYRAMSGWILEPLLTFTATASIQTVVAERSLLAEVGGFDTSLPMRADYDLALRLAARSEVCALAETLTLIRVHPLRTTTLRRDAELFGWNERVFRKAGGAAPTAALRALCRRQRARQLAGQARALSREGAHWDAFHSLGRAAVVSPTTVEVWRTSVRCTLAALGTG
jgi:glycosyltransferase involved in cell wall biosynthesis